MMISSLLLTVVLTAAVAAEPAASAPCVQGRGWVYDAAKGRCTKDDAYWKNKHGEKPCPAQVAPRWSSCVSDSRMIPQLAHGQSIELKDTVGSARSGFVGSRVLVCQYGVLKDARNADGSRNRGTCYRIGSAEDPASAAGDGLKPPQK